MSLLLYRTFPIRTRTAVRALSSTTPRYISLQLEKNDPEAVADTIPAYPYGPARWYKQSDLGLYGGQRIQFGNNVGPKSKTKTRRTWHPNVFRKRLYSSALKRHIQLRVTTRVLRTIDKLGGLDNYLLGDKAARIKELGMSGWWLRWAIMQTPAIKKRFEEERIALGLPAKGIDEMIEEEKASMPRDVEIGAPAQLDAADGEDIVLDPEIGAEQDEAELIETDGEGLTLDSEAVQVEDESHVSKLLQSSITKVTADHPIGSTDTTTELLPQKRLKFRAGPKVHIYLTDQGWSRTQPSAEIVFKNWFRKTSEKYRNLREDQTEIAFREFDKIVKRKELSGSETQSLRARLRNEVNKRVEAFVETAWQRNAVRKAIHTVISPEELRQMLKKGYEAPVTRSQTRKLVKQERQKQKAAAAMERES